MPGTPSSTASIASRTGCCVPCAPPPPPPPPSLLGVQGKLGRPGRAARAPGRWSSLPARPPRAGPRRGWGFPGSFAERGTRSQFSPASVVCSRMAGLPQIQPSCPLKEMELKR